METKKLADWSLLLYLVTLRKSARYPMDPAIPR